MSSIHYSPAALDAYSLISRFDEFPPGCDPDFDNDMQELERQFAEIRMTHEHH
jgi:hypothetical protein